MRRIGVLMNTTADDAEGQARLVAFVQGMQEAGWAVGRNMLIDIRWGAGIADSFRRYAVELVALTPDVILGASGTTVPHCCRQPARCRSCSRRLAIRSVLALWQASRGRAAMPPDLPNSNSA